MKHWITILFLLCASIASALEFGQAPRQGMGLSGAANVANTDDGVEFYRLDNDRPYTGVSTADLLTPDGLATSGVDPAQPLVVRVRALTLDEAGGSGSTSANQSKVLQIGIGTSFEDRAIYSFDVSGVGTSFTEVRATTNFGSPVATNGAWRPGSVANFIVLRSGEINYAFEVDSISAVTRDDL